MESEERSATPLAGGIMGRGYQCGMVWGASLAAGAQAYRLLGSGPRAEARAIAAAQGIVESFRALNKAVDCFDITTLNDSSTAGQMVTQFLVKGGAVRCFSMAARYAPVALNELSRALSAEGPETPPAPVSCAAMLAQRMGASDMHTVMAAGLAGGIGLSGGACGALGAAIWIDGMNSLKKAGGKIRYKSPGALETIDRFIKCTNHEFECSKIVGRKFEGIGDHAGYVAGGGCSEVIEALAVT